MEKKQSIELSEENAVQLTISLVMLRDNYELRSFTERRQSALIALVECCPKRAAQYDQSFIFILWFLMLRLF